MNEIKNRKLLIGWSAGFLTRLDDMGPFLFRGRSFFQPGTRLEHFLIVKGPGLMRSRGFL